MMAKVFYKLAEAMETLHTDRDGITQLVREGKLREYRDGPELMFKVEQVEGLKSELGLDDGSDQIDLGPSDTGGPLGLEPGASASGSVISLADTSGSPDDTATDIGLSASSTGSASGINVLGMDDSTADPSAQTAVGGYQASSDSIGLEAMGSGSGLLDLSRERDDTSLGEVLEGISPGGSRGGDVLEGTGAAVAGGAALGSMPPPRAVGGPVYVTAHDPMAAAFGGAALAASIVGVLAILAIAEGLFGTSTPLTSFLRNENGASLPATWIAGGGVALALVFFVVGMVLGKKA